MLLDALVPLPTTNRSFFSVALNFPIATRFCLSAFVCSPNAIEFSPDASLLSPPANEFFPLATFSFPMTIDFTPVLESIDGSLAASVEMSNVPLAPTVALSPIKIPVK